MCSNEGVDLQIRCGLFDDNAVSLSHMILSRTTQNCVLRNCCFDADKY
jgi:hypothetical protein